MLGVACIRLHTFTDVFSEAATKYCVCAAVAYNSPINSRRAGSDTYYVQPLVSVGRLLALKACYGTTGSPQHTSAAKMTL